MTTKDLTHHIGQTLRWDSGRKMHFNVKVLDARQMYGRTDLLITPISGQFEAWVSAESCNPPSPGSGAASQQETK